MSLELPQQLTKEELAACQRLAEKKSLDEYSLQLLQESYRGRKQQADALMRQLPSLDFNNQEKILDWLCAFVVPCNVVEDLQEVIGIFTSHGYEAGVNAGEAYKGEDKDNVARYIVGQALSSMRDEGFVPQVIEGFMTDWKTKFASWSIRCSHSFS